jgi:DNA-binding response OmpR family regulator
LIVSEDGVSALQRAFASVGYQTSTATIATAQKAISDFSPDVALIELKSGSVRSENESLALARRLRTEPATYALPLVLLCQTDDESIRRAALSIGADDYFPLSTPTNEMIARLDSIFWRTEAGRRSAASVGDQRLEIDNFILMLDSVREDIRVGSTGTLALIYAVARDPKKPFDKAIRDRTLTDAVGFLKIQLRRIDSVAYYGPTALLAYLPQMKSKAAVSALARLRYDFLVGRPDSDIAIGLASFPEDETDIEKLIEKAEVAVKAADPGVGVLEDEGGISNVITTRKREEAPDSPATLPTATGIEEEEIEIDLTDENEIEFDLIDDDGLEADVLSLGELDIPLVQASRGDEMSAAEAATRERELREGGASMPTRLLIVISDSKLMTQLNSLVRSAGYEARAAFDGGQALDLLRIERPNLLVLDYNLRGFDGLETLRRLRKLGPNYESLPVVLLIPTADERVATDAARLGAKCVVSSGFSPGDFLECVRTTGNVD